MLPADLIILSVVVLPAIIFFLWVLHHPIGESRPAVKRRKFTEALLESVANPGDLFQPPIGITQNFMSGSLRPVGEGKRSKFGSR
jgi:hypothetical protein